MGKRRSMMRKKMYDDAYNRQPIKPWSDLTHDVLLLVMMKLEVVDFLEFRRVCKSWRSVAVSNRNEFIVAKPPMAIRISTNANVKEYYLEDFEGRKFRKFRIIHPHSDDTTYIGVTCGYLIFLCGKKTRDLWLVNPITRHELHFPRIPFGDVYDEGNIRAILVFSPSVPRWVFVITDPFYPKIWFSVGVKGEWTHVPTTFRIIDLQDFKGKIYAIDEGHHLSEVEVYPTPKLTLLEIRFFPNLDLFLPLFLSLGENLYLWDIKSTPDYKIHEIDIGKMKCVSRGKTLEDYGFFCTNLKYGVSCTNTYLNYINLTVIDNRHGKWDIIYRKEWYFFHDCLNVNLVHEG